MLLIAVDSAAADAAAAPAGLAEQLAAMVFHNEGVTRSGTAITVADVPCGYLEPENVTTPEFSWASRQKCGFPFVNNHSHGHTPPASCKLDGAIQPEMDSHSDDLQQVVPPSADAEACLPLCCSNEGCVAFVFSPKAPKGMGACKADGPCCYLKSRQAEPTHSGLPGISYGKIAGRGGGSEIPAGLVPPPLGIRSAVPLGGIGAGSMELRGDGTLQQFTIWNNYPAGAPKFWAFPDAVFGMRVGGKAVSLRTSPPAGIPGVAALKYSGAHPMSRLTVDDPAIEGVNASLFGYSAYFVGDMDKSGTPAVAFSLLVENTGSTPVDVDFVLTLPFSIEPESSRPVGQPDGGEQVEASTPEQCLAQCVASATCASWTLDASGTCTLATSVPFNRYTPGAHSGVKSTFVAKKNATDAKVGGGCLTLDRPGKGPAQGGLSACGFGTENMPSVATAPSMAKLWSEFSSTGMMAGKVTASDGYGAVAVHAKAIAAGEKRALSITLGWHYPERAYLSERVGNWYSTLHTDSEAAAKSLDLEETVEAISTLHSVFFDSVPETTSSAKGGLPEWLADILVNMLSHVRSAWWEEDGKWRQWEAYDCVNVDSVHNDGERHIPYISIFPASTKNKLAAWGATQLPNGMIPEQLACGCTSKIDPGLDKGCGRVMSDVSSMYITYILELYRWQNDTKTLHELWPVVKKAALWQMNVSTDDGTPEHLENTYDILGPTRYKHVSYNTVFHLLAMKAAAELATVMGDIDFATTCTTALKRGQTAFDEQQWVTNMTGAPHYSFAADRSQSLMADSLYGQLLADSSGLGTLLAVEDNIKRHLETEAKWNDSPHGLRVESEMGVSTGSGEAVWQGASPNWASINIRHGFMGVDEALEQPKKSLGLWRSELNDLWNICGLSQNGQSWITSHYGFAMTAWHLPYAISGQTADLPRGSLTFDPKLTEAMWTLPWFLPNVLGTLSKTSGGYELLVKIGSLELTHLAVGSSVHRGAVSLEAGEKVAWN
eukprot:COSAG02_NODE_4850_length_4905_cov_6.344985_1_plen_1001_part_00